MLNKKISVAGLLLGLMGSSVAHALTYDDTTFNAGLEISFINRTSYNSSGVDQSFFKAQPTDTKLAIQKNEPGVNAYVGARFSENWGGQVGFSFIQEASANVPYGQATNKISNIYLDGLGLVNIAQNLDMLGLVGFGMLKSAPNVTNASFGDMSALTKRKIGIRLGGGLQYYFADQWATRITLIYQKGNADFLKTLWSAAIGLVYTFDM